LVLAAPLDAAHEQDHPDHDQEHRQGGLADRAEVVAAADAQDRLEEHKADQEDHQADEKQGAAGAQLVLVAVT